MEGSNGKFLNVKEGHDNDQYVASPWADDTRSDEKTEIFKTACMLGNGPPDGIPFPRLLDAVFGDAWDPHDSNYMLAYRLCENYPELLEKHKPMGDLLWVRPTPEAVSLFRSMQRVGNIDETESVELRSDEPPRQRAKRLLSNISKIRTDGQRGLALKLLAYHRGTMKKKDGSPKWVAVGEPGTAERGRVRVTDRFTDIDRAARPRSAYEEVVIV